MKIGYTLGVFDLLHIGHLSLLKRAKRKCDFLIVAVTSDNLTYTLKHKKPIICEKDRVRLVRNLKCVDKAILVTRRKELKDCKMHNVNCVFKGDDWKHSSRWYKLEKELNKIGVSVVFLSYTKKISTTYLRELLKNEE